ncbi:MAG: beta-1,6-N-acetylglucosaminyltransferase [Candidatus Omnitrophota bacterium]
MKIAYLILAHHQPGHLKRLIEALKYKNDAFFVHIDLKSDMSEFKDIKGEDIFFMPERVKVYHAGFSQVEAMIFLMQAASKKEDFDYYIFLSGADYPIKAPAKIHDFLKKNYGQNFLSFYNYSADLVENSHLSGYYNVDFSDSVLKIVSLISRVIFKLSRKVLPKRSLADGMIPYRGSTHWCLYKDVMNYLLKFLDSDKGGKLVRFFRNSFGPDEMIFHTIILNSSFAKSCRGYETDMENDKRILLGENKAYLHYIDWNPDREDPAVFDEGDFEKLKESDLFFARKFDEKKSYKLLDKIDRYLLGDDK